MLPHDADPFWKYKAIYEMLLDPVTTAASNKYFPAILETELTYCKAEGSPLSIVVLNIPNLATCTNTIYAFKAYSFVRRIICIIKEKLQHDDMVFYNGDQTFFFLLPKSGKENILKLINDLETVLKHISLDNIPLKIKGGYAEFPTDAETSIQLQECASNALSTANNLPGNRIIGYFSERRNNLRMPLNAEVRYSAADSPERLTCCRNLSETGIMLNGMPDLQLGDNIKLNFNLTGPVENKIITLAKTIWCKISSETGKMDIGLFFTYLNNSSKESIKNFISGYILKTFPPISHL